MLRHQFLLAMAIALAILLAAAPVVSGASTNAWLISTKCTNSGGASGYGYVTLKVGASEIGKSGVNKIVFRIRLIRSKTRSGAGIVAAQTSNSSRYFPNTARNHSYTNSSRANLDRLHRSYYYRLETVVQFWRTDGPDKILRKIKIVGKSC
ncbi:MAG TPA: hypothetical protein VNT28_03935 [Candidatus Limnocylindrales bacterium]|jgi:hypothetical protein|nr:hypothetical protein [Candidatus Limnocylindrales bacterium]